jgi:NADH-ubiquinone oxidoreductase chain 4
VKAPASGSMILAGVLLKLGGYGLFHVFPILSKYGFGFSVVWVVLILVGGLFVNLFHTQQTDLKPLTTYSSAAHISVITGSIITQLLRGL